MKLPFFNSSPPTREYYFGLFLKENQGIGYIFASENKKISLITKQEFRYSNGWENLTNDVDEALFKMENETKAHPNKVIVFIFSHLVDERTKEIKKPYLQKIKDLTRNLEIKPIGYIECYEAVSFFLQKRDGSPLTSILIELDDSSVGVFIYKGGHKVHGSILSRTDDIVSDLHAVFDTMGSTLLPNRIVLYNSSNLVEESTKIITHKWSSDLFVQIPRVEILKEGDIVKGCMDVFAEQLNQVESTAAAAPIAEPAYEVDEEEAAPKQHDKAAATSVLGFEIGRDVVELGMEPPKAEKAVPEAEFTPKRSGPDMKAIFSSMTAGASKFPFKSLLVLLIPVACIVGLIIAIESFSHKATVQAVLPSQPIENSMSQDAVIGTTEDGFMTIKVASSSVTLSDVRATTGKRDVGDKAQGEVTVYNFDDKDRTFSKGTVIQVDSLQFTMNDDVKVAASALTSDASAKLPGKSKVKVTAKDLGPESNIDKGKRFKIADLSSSTFFAMNDAGFTGGTRKTIKTVSKKDIDDLAASVMAKAKEQKQQELASQNNELITMVDSLTEYDLSGAKYSKEVGEEGDTVKLDTTVVATYYFFENSYVNSKIKEELMKDVQPGYELTEKNISYKIDDVKKDKNGIHLKLSAHAKATKTIDLSAALKSIKGKSLTDARSVLEKTYAATDATFTVSPPLPPFNAFLPLMERNITIRIEWQ